MKGDKWEKVGITQEESREKNSSQTNFKTTPKEYKTKKIKEKTMLVLSFFLAYSNIFLSYLLSQSPELAHFSAKGGPAFGGLQRLFLLILAQTARNSGLCNRIIFKVKSTCLSVNITTQWIRRED